MLLVLDYFKCLYFRSKYTENWIDSYLNNGYRMMEYGKESKELQDLRVLASITPTERKSTQKMTRRRV
jgi:hypothetical protein